MKDIFEIENWVSVDELNRISKIANNWIPVEFRPNYGRFSNELIAIQRWHTWNNSDELGVLLNDRMQQVFGNNLKVIEVDYLELYLPWDIHSEGHRLDQGSDIGYTVIIPMDDYRSRTIVFNQASGDYNDFYKYKQSGIKCEVPVDLTFWENNLSHCWDEDREYLSLKYVSQDWGAGNTMFFKRNLFHSSDNFHTRNVGPKRFLQVVVDPA